jgi:hypothetical protein
MPTPLIEPLARVSADHPYLAAGVVLAAVLFALPPALDAAARFLRAVRRDP